MSDEPDDTLPALIAGIDQMRAVIPVLAPVVRSWYDSFIEQGFKEDQALYLAAVQVTSNPGTPPT